jgi:transposase
MRSSVSVTERRPYPSDISDARWALIEPVLSAWQEARLARNPVQRRPKYELRKIWNALLYLNRTGVQWQYLPHDFPHYQSVNSYYNAWRDEGVFEQLNAGMTRLARIKAKGFHVVKRRWVERTFGWLMMHRRLARDYEKYPGSSRAMIYLAMIDNTAKRITGETTPTWRNTPQDHQAVTSTL